MLYCRFLLSIARNNDRRNRIILVKRIIGEDTKHWYASLVRSRSFTFVSCLSARASPFSESEVSLYSFLIIISSKYYIIHCILYHSMKCGCNLSSDFLVCLVCTLLSQRRETGNGDCKILQNVRRHEGWDAMVQRKGRCRSIESVLLERSKLIGVGLYK
jgi:hypothetical protein